jgi:hypothetical protein
MYLIAEFLDEHLPIGDTASCHGQSRGWSRATTDPCRANTFSLRDQWMGLEFGQQGRIVEGLGALIEHVVSEWREARQLDPSRRCRDGHRRGSRTDRRTLSRRAPSSMPMPRPYRGTSPPARDNGSKINLGTSLTCNRRDLCAGVELRKIGPANRRPDSSRPVFNDGNWQSSIQTFRWRHAEDRPPDERNAWSLRLSCAPAIARRSRG